MKLSELEERAQQKREEQAAEAAKLEAEEQAAEEAATELFRQEVITWICGWEQDGQQLNPNEIEDILSVTDRSRGYIAINVPEHTTISFRVIPEDEGFKLHNGWFYIEEAYGPSNMYCASLSYALLLATEQYRERMSQEERDAKWQDEREKTHEREKIEAAKRGNKYLAWLDEYPILRPILDILGTFLEERERVNHDIEMAEELAARVETRLGEKLEQARYDADCYARERDDLQRDLWDEQEKARKAEQRCKHR